MNVRHSISKTQLALRSAVLVAVFIVIVSTRAAGSSVPLIELAIAACGLICAFAPGTHVGLLLTVLITVHWLVAVDDAASPWVLGVGVSVAVLHLTMAAASVSPPTAEWTAAMRTRWGRRLGLLAAVTVPTWLLVVLIEQFEIGRSPVLVTVALVGVALSLLWVSGNLTRET